jgi:anti-sigma-K factor RskA
MTHEELSDLYELYALGVLDPPERVELEEHLARNCPECKAGIHKAMVLGSYLAALPEPVEPSKKLRRRILASVGTEPKTSGLWTGALAFLSACLLIGVVLLGMERPRHAEEVAQLRGQIRQSGDDLSRAQARIAEVLQFLNAPETRQVVFGKGQPTPPSGRIFVNALRGVMLIASHLPKPPLGKTYEMWIVPKKGAPVPAGLFQSDAQGNAVFLRNQTVDVAATGAVAVTLEPEAGSTTPTMPLVLAAPLE